MARGENRCFVHERDFCPRVAAPLEAEFRVVASSQPLWIPPALDLASETSEKSPVSAGFVWIP